MMPYICTKLHENIHCGFEDQRVDMILIQKISKGHNSAKIGGITVLVLCTSSDDAL